MTNVTPHGEALAFPAGFTWGAVLAHRDMMKVFGELG